MYYDNGQLKKEGYYNDDKEEGLWKEYYDNGQLASYKSYKEGELISNKCWDEEGNEIDCE